MSRDNKYIAFSLFILIAIIFYHLIPILYARLYYIPNKVIPPHEYALIEEIENRLGTQLQISSKHIESMDYIIGEGPRLLWAKTSGPPVYIFDNTKRLIDYTLDSGDDPEFFDKWLKERM